LTASFLIATLPIEAGQSSAVGVKTPLGPIRDGGGFAGLSKYDPIGGRRFLLRHREMGGMDRQRILALVLALLMIGSSVAYAVALL